MKTDAEATRRYSSTFSLPITWRDVSRPIRRFPQRLRERRFWHVQLLVLAATAPHYALEGLGMGNPSEELYGLAITAYLVPVLFAALAYGWEGAILTGLWAGLLTSASVWIWDHSVYHWLGELGQLAIILPVGVLVAWRVHLEAKQRRIAEKTSSNLKLLNEVGELLGRTMEVEQRLPLVIQRVRDALSLACCWLCLEPETDNDGQLEVIESCESGAAGPAVDHHQQLMAGKGPGQADGRTAAVPLQGETGALGSLGARAREHETLSKEQIGLLTTIAHEIRVALENTRLYRQRQESLKSYVRQVTQAQEDERLRIARELHDETAQELVHVSRKLEQLLAEADASLKPAIQELIVMSRATMQAVRRYSRDLRPSVLDDLGLLPALEMAIEDTGQHLPGGARLLVTGEPRRLEGTVELALFRIAQEGLRNVEKHAGADSATVEMEFGDDQVKVSISDDGRGFAPAKNPSDLIRRGKLGVLGMKERAELVGGTFDLCSNPGGGTRVAVTVSTNGSQR